MMETPSPSRSSSEPDPVSVAARILPVDDGEGPSGPSPRRRGAREWTPEQRQAASERMRKAHAEGTAPTGARSSGRPRKPLSAEDEAKRAEARKRAEAQRRAAEPVDPAEAVVVGRFLGVVWGLAGPFIKCRPLEQDQELKLGSAAVPVLRKYLPGLEDWGAEIALVVTIGALYQATHYTEKDDHADQTAPIAGLEVRGVATESQNGG